MTKMLEHEVEALRRVPLFSGVEPMKLKLLAFASERVEFAGEFKRGVVELGAEEAQALNRFQSGNLFEVGGVAFPTVVEFQADDRLLDNEPDQALARIDEQGRLGSTRFARGFVANRP